MDHGVPAAHFADFDLSSLRMTIVAARPPSDRHAAHCIPWRLLPCMAGGRPNPPAWYLHRPTDNADTLVRTAGRAASEFDVRIVDSAANAAARPDRRDRRTGPCVMKGYVQLRWTTMRADAEAGSHRRHRPPG
ncbi:hypothetical protein [Candidatus Amarolinea dominans]|uniref:hypothetical protein n=1 Tax=Candidatus Amarolinea dominans TaxID=3140696 RepID=UPI001D21C0F1|nr:hypothetical protein [Anaerolineae bacterium]